MATEGARKGRPPVIRGAHPHSCPVCLAAEGLAHLRAMERGLDVPELGLKLNGKPLNHSAQAGFGEAFLRQMLEQSGALCSEHWARRPGA